jgi:hypothetical protein
LAPDGSDSHGTLGASHPTNIIIEVSAAILLRGFVPRLLRVRRAKAPRTGRFLRNTRELTGVSREPPRTTALGTELECDDSR